MMASKNIQVEIRPHPRAPETHRRAVVTTQKGRCYYCDWAEPWPTEEVVRQTWENDRRAFQPDYTGGAM